MESARILTKFEQAVGGDMHIGNGYPKRTRDIEFVNENWGNTRSSGRGIKKDRYGRLFDVGT